NFQLSSENEVREMAHSVLTGLTWLHKNGYVHRDIRISNVVFVPNIRNYRYALIDFEHGSADGLEASERLMDWDGATLMSNNKYTSQSDLYQFGKMLRNLNIVNSEVGKKFLDDLRNKSVDTSNILDHAWFR
ncbi:7531_t:CDS:1, partial [Paraglomus occultum]